MESVGNPAAEGGGGEAAIVVPEYASETDDAQPKAAAAPESPAAAFRREHRWAVKLQRFVALLVPFNILRHVRVLPSAPDEISCHFRTDGLAAESPRLSYVGFLVAWVAGACLVAAALHGALHFVATTAARQQTPSEDRGHRLSMLALLYFGTPTLFTYMFINLAVIEANAEDSFVLPPALGGPAMCPADTCKPCAVFVPLYFACVAGQRFVATVVLWLAAVGLLVNLHPSPAALGPPLFSLPQLAARLGAPFSGRGSVSEAAAQEHGLKLATVLLWLLWVGSLELINTTTPGTGWPYDGSCYHTEEGYLTCSTGGSPSAGGACAGSEDTCSCDDKFACDGCHSEYPHDMGFVMEKVGSGFACVPECVFAGGVVNYQSYLCECAEGFQASASLDGFGASVCVPSVQCTAQQRSTCSPHAACAVRASSSGGGGDVVCACDRLFWGDRDGRTCTRWTECDLCRDLAPGQAPASGRVCQYMTQQPDALTDRRCADATVCGALGELTPLEETRDRTCVGSG